VRARRRSRCCSSRRRVAAHSARCSGVGPRLFFAIFLLSQEIEDLVELSVHLHPERDRVVDEFVVEQDASVARPRYERKASK
jgi:hypothetical protein